MHCFISNSVVSRNHQAITLQQATRLAPVLSGLMARAEESQKMLTRVLPLIPLGLHAQIRAGSWDGSSWCLLVNTSASASKLKQLCPLLQARLLNGGWKVSAIRIKLQVVAR
jgi:hypothetical protein